MEKLDKKTFVIGVLLVSAVVLFVTNLIQPRPAVAQMSIKDRDYQVVTAHATRGGDALYITDNKTGKVAVYQYNPSKRSVDLADVQPIMGAFAGPAMAPVNPKGARPAK